MLNPSLRSHFLPLENKKNVQKIKNVQNAFFIKIIKSVKKFFTSMILMMIIVILKLYHQVWTLQTAGTRV